MEGQGEAVQEDSTLLYASVCPLLPPLTQNTKTRHLFLDQLEGARSVTHFTPYSEKTILNPNCLPISAKTRFADLIFLRLSKNVVLIFEERFM